MGFLGKGKRIGGSMEKKTKNAVESKIKFSFNFPEAKEVFLAGDFNGWDIQSIPLKKKGKGAWEAKLNLFPGRYEYKLMVDGAWSRTSVAQRWFPILSARTTASSEWNNRRFWKGFLSSQAENPRFRGPSLPPKK